MTEVWNPSDLGLVESADTPALNALIHAYMERVNVLFPLITRAAELLGSSDSKAAVIEQIVSLGPMVEEFSELAGWLYPARRALTMEEAVRYALRLQEDGFDSQLAKDTTLGLQRPPAGRPHKRERYLAAFDLMLQKRGMSLGKAVHTLNPSMNVEQFEDTKRETKAGIVSLKKLLRKYAPELVLRYDELHPDRAKLRDLHNKKVNG